MSLKNKIIISGPCSAESFEQVIDTATALKQAGVDIFRAGLWKPRTKPGGFEGVGGEGLQWLAYVQNKMHLDVITEVAQPEHIQPCIDHGISKMWIGARTTSNPFSVSELAKKLRGRNVIVGIKNPISPDIDLWIGAIERIKEAGVQKVFAIHRGFYTNNGKYRNNPVWSIPIELKRRFPDMDIVCDPSHICGNKELIPSITQRSMDLLFNGLMIESHIQPETALTDAKQQLTPSELQHLLKNVIIVQDSSQNSEYLSRLSILRSQIDVIDDEILDMLQTRMVVSRYIGEIKGKEGTSILQPGRWTDVLNDRIFKGVKLGLSEKTIRNIFENIHEESINIQAEWRER